MTKLTRRELADYVATQLQAGNGTVVEELAAYLIESRRTREAGLIVRDIESALARRGIVVAHVSSAHTLDASSRSSLEAVLKQTFGATSLQLKERVEPALLGGVKVIAADKELDASARRRLQQLKSVKV